MNYLKNEMYCHSERRPKGSSEPACRQAGNLVLSIEVKTEISLPLKRDRNDND